MWIKEIKKSNSPKGKTFFQYQLTETLRIDGKVKHKAILYLGYHKLLKNKKNRQKVSKLLEYRIQNKFQLPGQGYYASIELEQLGEKYYNKYLLKHQVDQEDKEREPKAAKVNYELIDLESTEVFNCREIGAEWLCYKITAQLDIKGFLKRSGWTNKWIEYGLISIISRAVFASSEHKTQHWLHNNSGLLELFGSNSANITRHHLYQASSRLYSLKAILEPWLYERTRDLFNLDENLLIYDLTNTYFEGRKVGSKLARYGKSKEKRKDCKLVVLAAVINSYGFLKHSHIYEGNMSDNKTLADMVDDLQKHSQQASQRQTIVIDAGIATEDNLKMLKDKALKYVCVSRKKLKDYQVFIGDKTVSIADKRKNLIELKIISQPDESWLYVHSEMKEKKEGSMLQNALQRFEHELENVRQGISKKGGVKKIEKVWERIGRIKEQNQSVHKYFNINISQNNGIATAINWLKNEKLEGQNQTGIYFLRTNYDIKDEKELWNMYNLIREIESTFRCLKTDLNIRPVFHQKDQYTEAHLNLGLLAYQLVSTIRYRLKEQNIHHDWRKIVRIMNTQKITTIKQRAKDKDIALRICSRPIQEALQIYKAIGISSMPMSQKKSVVLH